MASETLDLEQLIGWDGLLRDDERLVRANVRRFVQQRCMPRIVADYEAGRFAQELMPEMASLGLLGANLEGYGCAGMGPVAYGLACHKIEACDSGLRSFVSVQTSLAMYAIHRFGSNEQKERWLPEMAGGLGSEGAAGVPRQCALRRGLGRSGRRPRLPRGGPLVHQGADAVRRADRVEAAGAARARGRGQRGGEGLDPFAALCAPQGSG